VVLLYFSLNLCGVYICNYLVLTKWYQRTFLGRKCGQIFFFADLFFRKKKRAATFQMISVVLVQNLKKMVVNLSSSQKNTKVKKKKKKSSETESGKSSYLHFKICNFQGFFFSWTTA
jgi:hypothetical protein